MLYFWEENFIIFKKYIIGILPLLTLEREYDDVSPGPAAPPVCQVLRHSLRSSGILQAYIFSA